MASKVALAVDGETKGELELKDSTGNYSSTEVSGIEKGNREDHRQSFCRALQSQFLSLLITTTPPQQRWGWAEQGEKKKKKDTGHSHYTRLTKVSKGSCAAPGGGVAVINTGHHEQLLGHRSRHDSSTTGGRDETHQDWATAARHLAGYGVRLTNLVTPITSPDRDNRQLGKDDRPTDGCGHLFGALHSQTHMTIVVTNGNKGL